MTIIYQRRSMISSFKSNKAVYLSALAVIPARAGSKGIPNKNKRLMCGQPLIAWTIRAAQMADSVDEIVVTTDDEDIAEIARNLGVIIPFMRPPKLAQDETPGIEPILHALSMVQGFDEVVILQPTSPLRSAADIDAVAELAKTASSVVSVCETQKPIQWTFTIEDNGFLKPVWLGEMATLRQDIPATYALNGAVYYCDIPLLLKTEKLINESTVPYIMPPERSVDIDTPYDWMLAEYLCSQNRI